MIIRNATPADLTSIVDIEAHTAQIDAADLTVLTQRLHMFPAGFFVAELDQHIVGYLESCLWDREVFQNFQHIRDFPGLHNPDGNNLYIIYIAVDRCYRNRGVGSALLRAAQRFAAAQRKSKIQLVASEALRMFYAQYGFSVQARIPDFLPQFDGWLMQYRVPSTEYSLRPCVL